MSRNLAKPFFGKPPPEYSIAYMDSLVRSFALYIQQMQNPGDGRNTTQVFTNLPNNDSGLENGTVFVVDGVLRVPVAHQPYAAGVLGTGQIGTVTVTV